MLRLPWLPDTYFDLTIDEKLFSQWILHRNLAAKLQLLDRIENLEEKRTSHSTNRPSHYFSRTDLKKRNFDLGSVFHRHPSVRLHPHLDVYAWMCVLDTETKTGSRDLVFRVDFRLETKDFP